MTRTLPYALAQFLLVAFQWTSMLFLPLHFKAQGVSETGVGALISVFSLSTLLLVLPLGILSDRLPPRPMMAVGAAVAFVAYALAPGVQGVGWMVLVVALAGAGYTLSSISLYSLFFKRVGADRLIAQQCRAQKDRANHDERDRKHHGFPPGESGQPQRHQKRREPERHGAEAQHQGDAPQ